MKKEEEKETKEQENSAEESSTETTEKKEDMKNEHSTPEEKASSAENTPDANVEMEQEEQKDADNTEVENKEGTPEDDIQVNKEGYDWYFLQVLSGSEEKVMLRIQKFVKLNSMEEHICHIIIPHYETEEKKRGEVKLAQKKLYPGYLLVQMRVLPENWAKLRSIDGVIDFVGTKYDHAPYPLTETEKREIFFDKKSRRKKKPKKTFERGEKIKVIDGPFANFLGHVEDIFEDRRHVNVMISIFGRPTPVELSYDQIEKL